MKILSVSQLTKQIGDKLEASFPFVWVQGQVTNLSRPFSGHLYFSLKDANASIAAVWFKGKRREHQKFDPLTGEVFDADSAPDLSSVLANGQEISCAGRVCVYGPRGQYQLVVELAQEVGLGKLHQEFERLKLKLAQQGFFEQARKRALPKNPSKIALITSPSGAALYDFIKVGQSRGCGAQIRLYPVLVQGNEAAADIIKALEQINQDNWAQVVVIIRGGGSLEDLWAFNSEFLAEAVVNSQIPVLAGIGHEVDFSMTDLSADLRAATPSHAAQLLWTERQEFVQKLDELSLRLEQAMQQTLLRRVAKMQHLESALAWFSPLKSLQRNGERLERLAGVNGRLELAFKRIIKDKAQDLSSLERSLLASFSAKNIKDLENRLARLSFGLEQSCAKYLNNLQDQLKILELRLEGRSPLAPLARGYALIQKANGSYVQSKEQVAAGEALQLRVSDGEFTVEVR